MTDAFRISVDDLTLRLLRRAAPDFAGGREAGRAGLHRAADAMFAKGLARGPASTLRSSVFYRCLAYLDRTDWDIAAAIEIARETKDIWGHARWSAKQVRRPDRRPRRGR